MNGEKLVRASSRDGESVDRREVSREVAGDRGRKVGEAMRLRLPVQLTMRDFSDIYPEREIAADERYVAETKRRIGETSSPAAQAFERMFVAGVQVGRWLGNTSTGSDVNFTTQTYQATDYDDLRHKVDAFTTLRFDEPVETYAGDISKLPLGFDVTINSSREKIVDKLTRCSNAPTPLPFGFSELDYYSDGEQKSKFNLLPRYVIGLSATEIKGLKNDASVDPNTGAMRLNSLSPRALLARFKVLTEIRTQNELFQLMLPEGADESDDVRLRQASAYIEAADERLLHALKVCSDELIKSYPFPESVKKEIEENPFASPRPVIEECLFKRGHDDFVKAEKAYCERNGKEFKDDGTKDDTFVMIVKCTRQLHEAVMKDRPNGPYVSQGRVMAHTKGFGIPKK